MHKRFRLMERLRLDGGVKGAFVATVGVFDGVHLGHRALIDRVRALETTAMPSLLITFSPHPRQVITPNRAISLLCTQSEQDQRLALSGVSYVLVLPFDDAMMSLDRAEFMVLLRDRIGVRHWIVGHDHRFGKGRAGDFAYAYSRRVSGEFAVESIAGVQYLGEPISSTRIRTALLEGDILTANAMLGYGYSFVGEVVRGDGLGGQIGYPTANLAVDGDKLLPKRGIYAVRVVVSGAEYEGMLYIGEKTIKTSGMVCEVHIFGWSGGVLYGHSLEVVLVRFIRSGQRVGTIEALVGLLRDDEAAVKEVFRLGKAGLVG